MSRKIKSPSPMRDLYQLFRDGLLEDAHRSGERSFDLWRAIPKDNIGRLQTISLVRKMANRLCRQFPGGANVSRGKLVLTDDLVLFAHTHKEINSSDVEMIGAWAAMKGMLDDLG